MFIITKPVVWFGSFLASISFFVNTLTVTFKDFISNNNIKNTKKALALTVDCNARYVNADPEKGTMIAVAEAARNIVCSGGEPVAITNCLNFGNPENERNMGEFVECVQGISEASKYLDFPVVSGNVSFYNETKNKGIKPTPSIGGVGLIKNYKKMVTMDLKKVDNLVIVIGKTEGHLDQSIFARSILSEKKGPPPEINLFNEKNNGETILKLIEERLIESAHDISLGGIIIALARMCIKGNKGVKLNKLKSLINKFQYFFGEDQGRYIIEITKDNLKKVKEILNNNSVHYDELAIVVEKNIIIDKEPILTVDELMLSNKKWLKEYMVQ